MTRARYLALLFLCSFALNAVWEMAQMPLYANMPFDSISSWIECLTAAVGDAFITIGIWFFGALVFRSAGWTERLAPVRTAVLVASGALVAIVIEQISLGAGRWAYSPLMPIVPVAGTGVSPLVQLMLLPGVSMRLASRWLRRSVRAS